MRNRSFCDVSPRGINLNRWGRSLERNEKRNRGSEREFGGYSDHGVVSETADCRVWSASGVVFD
jgi:hypothetical protein